MLNLKPIPRVSLRNIPRLPAFSSFLAKAESYSTFYITLLLWGAAFILFIIFIFLVFEITLKGGSGLNLHFLLDLPEKSGRSGGIRSILVSTILTLLVCLLVTMPLGIGTALLLSERTLENTPFGRVTFLILRRSLDLLASVPSVVFGLFGNAFFCKKLGLGFSILSGGLTLACMVLPFFIRSVEVGLRSLPSEYQLARAALSISQTNFTWNVLIPLSTTHIGLGMVLAIGRALSETAALIYTSGFVDRMPESFLDSGRSLSVHIYDLAMNVPGGDANAYRSTFVLLVLVILINFGARMISKVGYIKGKEV